LGRGGFSSEHNGGFFAFSLDRRVHQIPDHVPLEEFRAAALCNDGKPAGELPW
jgi:hypothetical protein